MKLLFDENISFKLCKKLEDIYPDSTHVRFVNLENKDDSEIWQFAKDESYIIVTQDSDFNDMSILKGFPPYVVWIKMGNSFVSEIESILRTQSIRIREFFDNETIGLIEIEKKTTFLERGFDSPWKGVKASPLRRLAGCHQNLI
jgi:predicted nuclease of predicted toxin-antitoxin system